MLLETSPRTALQNSIFVVRFALLYHRDGFMFAVGGREVPPVDRPGTVMLDLIMFSLRFRLRGYCIVRGLSAVHQEVVHRHGRHRRSTLTGPTGQLRARSSACDLTHRYRLRVMRFKGPTQRPAFASNMGLSFARTPTKVGS